MKRILAVLIFLLAGVLLTTSCGKTKQCTCTSGGTYEIVDSALATLMGFPVPTTIFDTTLTEECYSLNYQDTTDVYYPDYGVVMNAYLNCAEK